MLSRGAALLLFLILLVGCAPLASIVPGQTARARVNAELTIIYTGYGRGNVDPAEDCG